MKLNVLVKDIIQSNIISKQTDITDILSKKYNIDITQSNISRILKQINAVKIMAKNKKVIYEIQEKLGETSVWMKAFIKKIEDNSNVIMIDTYQGSANIVAQVIDEANFSSVMGTLAGDNSVLIFPKDIKEIKKVKEEIIQILIQNNKNK